MIRLAAFGLLKHSYVANALMHGDLLINCKYTKTKSITFDTNHRMSMICDSCDRRPNKYVWHGATRRGEKADNCNAWHSSAANRVGHAASLQSMQLLAQEKIACDNLLAVLCIETNLPKRRRKRSLLDHAPQDDTVGPEVFPDATDDDDDMLYRQEKWEGDELQTIKHDMENFFVDQPLIRQKKDIGNENGNVSLLHHMGKDLYDSKPRIIVENRGRDRKDPVIKKDIYSFDQNKNHNISIKPNSDLGKVHSEKENKLNEVTDDRSFNEIHKAAKNQPDQQQDHSSVNSKTNTNYQTLHNKSSQSVKPHPHEGHVNQHQIQHRRHHRDQDPNDPHTIPIPDRVTRIRQVELALHRKEARKLLNQELLNRMDFSETQERKKTDNTTL